MKSQTLQYVIGPALLLTAVLALSGCGSNNNGNGGGGAPAPVGVAVAPLALTAPVQFMAINQAQNSTLVYGQPMASPTAQGSTFRPGAGWEGFMRTAMGICDRNAINGGTDSGSFACSKMVGAQAWILFDVQSVTSLTATLSVYVNKASVYSSYGFTSPSLSSILSSMLIGYNPSYNPTIEMNPLVLNSNTTPGNSPPTLNPTNGYQGFEYRTYGARGTYGNGALIQLIVPVGQLQNTSFDYELKYQGTSVATGKMVKTK